MKPTDYARFSYYEKWISALANMLVEKGIVTPAELAGKAEPQQSPLAERALKADAVAAATAFATGWPHWRTPIFPVPAVRPSGRLFRASNTRVTFPGQKFSIIDKAVDGTCLTSRSR